MTKPLPMIPGHAAVHNLGTQEIRLACGTIPQQVDKTKPLWIYQYRNSPTAEWNSFYCFGEFEFTPKDFEVVNYWTSTNLGPDNFQTTTVLVIRFLRGSEEEEEEGGGGGGGGGGGIVGKIMLINDLVKRNDGGKTVLIKTLKSDDERRETLKELFAIHLTDEEFGAIKGRNVELICA